MCASELGRPGNPVGRLKFGNLGIFRDPWNCGNFSHYGNGDVEVGLEHVARDSAVNCSATRRCACKGRRFEEAAIRAVSGAPSALLRRF